ncbi:hypothetical protein GO685_01255 [Wolbachia endosymbiont of Madathamugadia hiepei]|uniref:hypothetical protein n=1 Tax=Wolbachia endosymbiont of Madathamugadia hiepei TaxID=1241303 RepID=UPI00158EDADE|nr:hypothetical protein [Wolbachia endosymbiont of Madathamugadia hiepei]NUX01152.1 hypothetical protein [Wolbachia endosymbiont of Madathamugadia hiepei]
MLKYNVLMIIERLGSSVRYLDDTVCYANYLLIAMFISCASSAGMIPLAVKINVCL